MTESWSTFISTLKLSVPKEGCPSKIEGCVTVSAKQIPVCSSSDTNLTKSRCYDLVQPFLFSVK